MIRYAFALLLLLSAGTTFSQQSDIKSNITDVTVFLSGAQITRSASVTLVKGENTFRLSGLSRFVQGNSVQVEGNNAYTIQSVKHEMNYLENPENVERIEILQKEMDEVTFKRDLRKSLRSVYQEEKSMVLANKSIKGTEGVLLAEDLLEVADFYRERLTEIEYKLLEIKKEEREFNVEINRIQQELNKLGATRNMASSFVDVVVVATRAGKAPVDFSYMINAAAWIPSYDVRAEDVQSPLELVYKGRVLQNSGIDWKGVNLTMSTGNPNAGGVAPELNPWYLYLQEIIAYKNQQKQKYNERLSSNQRAYGYEQDAEPVMEMNAITMDRMDDISGAGNGFFAATISNNTLTTEFTIPTKYDIPSDNQYYDVEMKRIPMTASYEHFAIPKLDKDAFLIAGVTNWEEQALLAGKSNIYFKGTFVGEGFIDPSVTGDTLSISLGRDKSVPIKREQLTEFCKTSTFAGKKTTTKAYRIEVRNNKSVPVTLVIEDQIPRTTDNAIEVNVDELSGGKLDEESGKVEWELTLAPGESKELDLKFSVKYPKKKVVVGL